ncbi:MAG: sulfatase-like hydrolase/transferase [bacterium]
MKRFAWCLLVLPLAACDRAPEPDAVLLITIDTCRADRIGAYAPGWSGTPVVDALAARGALFERAEAPVPLTLPSHATILTGLYPDRHGLRDNGVGRLADEARTLAEVYADAGWDTGAFLAAVPLEARYGTDQGFATYDDDFLRGPAEGNILGRLLQDQRKAEEITTLAVPWLTRAAAADRPFFLWVHFFDPHSPIDPPAHLAARYPDDLYGAEVAAVDEAIGRLVAALGDRVDRTLVVVTADHGESLEEHGESSHGWFVYESTLHVPWVIAGPGVPAGARVSEPVSLVQTFPTLLELTGFEAPVGLDGASAAPLLNGRMTARRTPIYAETLFPRLNFGWSGSRAWRDGRWKLIEAPVPELYDLETDPGESRNLAVEQPDRVESLRADLHAFLARGGGLGSESMAVDEETRRRLDALGYVGGAGLAPEDSLWDFTALDPKDTIRRYRDLQQLPQVILGGSREEERAFVDRLLAGDPDNVSILSRVAQLRRKAGDVEGARDAAARLARIRPEDPGFAHDHALALEEAGDVAAAIRELARTIALDSTRAAAYVDRARLQRRAGADREAIATLESGVRATKDDPDLLNNLAWILADENLDARRALDLASRARAKAPDDPVVLDTFGWAAIRAGRAADAVDPLRRALAATGDAEVRAHLGVALAEAGNVEEGRSLVRAAVGERAELARIPEVARWMR